MKQILFVLTMALVLSSCAGSSGQLGTLPKLGAKDKGSKLVLIRDSGASGSELMAVLLDTKPILTLAKDEYAEFVVATGSHTLAVKPASPAATKPGANSALAPNNLMFIALGAQHSYFRISIETQGARIAPLDAKLAAKLMQGKKKIGP